MAGLGCAVNLRLCVQLIPAVPAMGSPYLLEHNSSGEQSSMPALPGLEITSSTHGVGLRRNRAVSFLQAEGSLTLLRGLVSAS